MKQIIRRDWTVREDGSKFLSGTEDITHHVVQALNSVEHGYQKTSLFHLREAIGEDTEMEQIGNHVFVDPTEKCVCIGCELKVRGFDRLQRVANQVDCPAKLEMFEHLIDQGEI